MAPRLPAVFALAAVLVLAAGIGPGNGQNLMIPVDWSTGCLSFPLTLFPVPPVRIISKADPSLSVAADGYGGVVLAKTNCRDARQLWVQDFSAIPAGDLSYLTTSGGKPFALVNLASITNPQAMQIADDGYPVKLAPYNKLSVPLSMLWTQDTSNPLANVFDKIRSVQNNQLVLDALGSQQVHEGTVVGAFHDFHLGNNVMWKIEGFLSNP